MTSSKTSESRKQPTMDEFNLNLFNNEVLSLKTKWQSIQEKFHSFLKSDISKTILICFDINKADEHVNAFTELARIFNEVSGIDCETFRDTIELWSNAVKDVQAYSTILATKVRSNQKNSTTEPRPVRLNAKQYALIGSGNIFVGMLIVNGDYYKALRVMIEMIKLGDTSPKLSLSALSLAIELEEMELFVEIRKLVQLKVITGVFATWLRALDQSLRIRVCKSEAEMDLLCSEIYSMLASLLNYKPKTYSMTYTEIALRNALIYASKQPNAKIRIIGDPLYHLHRCYDIAYNGLHGMFSDAVQSNGSLKMFDDEKPLVLFEKCFLFHQYCQVAGRYINELFDCGMLTDAEHRFIPYFKFALFSSSPYRLLNVANTFHLLRQLVEFKPETLQFVTEWIEKLCSIHFIPQHERLYAETLITEFSCNKYNELRKLLRSTTLMNQFGRREVVKLLFNNGVQKTQNFIPISYAGNLLRSTYYFFAHSSEGKRVLFKKQIEVTNEILQSCKSAENHCRAHWLLLRQFVRARFPFPQLTWISSSLPSQLQKHNADLSDDEFKNALFDAYTEYKKFQHLFYPTWRRQCAGYVAANVEQAMKMSRSSHIAMLLSESMSISLRSAIRLRETERVQPQRLMVELKKGKKQDDDLENALKTLTIDDSKNPKVPLFSTGCFGGSREFSDFILALPSDITILQMAFDSNNILWLTRFHCKQQEPYSIPLCYVKNGANGDVDSETLFKRLKEILKESEATTKVKEMVAREFWTKRRKLNTEMEELVNQMQEKIFGKLASLCYAYGPQATDFKNASKVQQEIEKLGFCRTSAIILTHLIDRIEKDEWQQIAKLMAERENLVNLKFLEDNKFESFQKQMGSKKRRCAGESYIFLIVPPSLSTIPWECMPVFQEALVSRIPSIFTLQSLLVKHKKMPRQINAQKSYYVLDPAGNLPATQERLQRFVSKMNWQGVTGKEPRKEDLTEALKSQDMYVFLGHGSGRKYIGSSREFRNLDCHSVCLLMGCSSVEILPEGNGFEGRGAVYDFMLAYCPCLVGCLWMVTDGEADRFFIELMHYCFEELQERQRELEEEKDKTPTNLTKSDGAFRLIMRGIAKARNVCKLPFLTGGAFVSYGLPTFAEF